MIWIWSILILVTILNIIWVVFEAKEDEPGVSLIVLFLGVVLIGWVIIGSLVTFDKKEFKLANKFEVIKGSNSIIVSDITSETFFVFNKKVDFEKITDTTTFYTTQGHNMYGFTQTKEDIYYYVYSDTIQNLDTTRVIGKYKVNGKKL